ncbi:MAG: hypothetical protein GY791_00400 [Alphaproteobacteria bacterium]|nr:hypothetical protein [Alphaproteobacteria bacterium]
MIVRILIILGVVALLGACSPKQDTGNWYCDRMPEDSFCTGSKNPNLFE